MRSSSSLRFLPLLSLALAVGASAQPSDPQAGAPAAEAVATKGPGSGPTPALYTEQVTDNDFSEVESATAALRVNGVDRTLTAYIREVDEVFRIRAAATDDPNGPWHDVEPSIPLSYQESVDPVLDVNPFADGVGAERAYLGGLTYALDAEKKKAYPHSIVVWPSSNGGASWQTPRFVETVTTEAQGALDKPDIAVSWFAGTRGYLYVAYVVVRRVDVTLTSELYIERSTDGGLTFPSRVLLSSGAFVQAPQVVVDSDRGTVHVIFVDFDNGRMRMASSKPTDFSNWTTETVVNEVRFLAPGDTIAGGPSCTRGVQAVTVPHARYNEVSKTIGVVWHERESDDSDSPTDVYFTSRGATGWQPRTRVNPSSANDQWYPALDHDGQGNYMVVYYDRRLDGQNLLYREAWSRLSPTGGLLASGFVANAFDSDPTDDTFVSSQRCFKGEYQDIWYWPYQDLQGGRFHAVWTGHPASDDHDDLYVSALQ